MQSMASLEQVDSWNGAPSKSMLIPLAIKEAKQLASLWLAVVLVGTILHVLGAMGATLSPIQFPHDAIFVLVPCLYAIGSGAMSVSQEKEQRTLGWIGSLPIPRNWLVLTKLGVGLIGLVTVWIASYLTMVPFSSFSNMETVLSSRDPDALSNFVSLLANSFFLLMTCYALAWYFSNALITLVCVIFAALVPLILLGVESWWVSRELFGEALTWNYIGLSILLGFLGIRMGMRSFVAHPAGALIPWAIKIERKTLPRSVKELGPPQPFVGLLWQVARQNGMLWFGYLVAVLIPWLRSTDRGEMGNAVSMLCWIVYLIILCWVGASVLGSDAMKQRIRFLADRGIDPGRVWWSRQLLPLGVVVVAVVMFGLAEWVSNQGPNVFHHSFRTPFLGVPPLIFLIISVGVYSMSQWSVQWTRSVLLAYCLAPGSALLFICYGMFSLSTLGTPWVLLVLITLIPLMASRWMMKSWMDGKSDWSYACQHALFFLLIFILSFSVYAITYVSSPGVSRTVTSAWIQEASQWKYVQPLTVEGIPHQRGASEEMPSGVSGALGDALGVESSQGQRELSDSDLVEKQIRFLEERAQTPLPIQTNAYVLRTIMNEVAYQRLKLEKDSDEGDAIPRYRRAFRVGHLIAKGMRRNPSVSTQEMADRVEAWMVREVSREGASKNLGSDLYSDIVASLQDKAQRNEARRRAILTGWMERFQTGRGLPSLSKPTLNPSTMTSDDRLGGVVLPRLRSPVLLAMGVLRQRQFDRAAEAMLNWLEHPSPKSKEAFSKFWYGRSELPEGASGLDQHVNPGLMWHGSWEEAASRLNRADTKGAE